METQFARSLRRPSTQGARCASPDLALRCSRKKTRTGTPMVGGFLHASVDGVVLTAVLSFLPVEEIGRLCFVTSCVAERDSSHEIAYQALCGAIGRFEARHVPLSDRSDTSSPANGLDTWRAHFKIIWPTSCTAARKADLREQLRGILRLGVDTAARHKEVRASEADHLVAFDTALHFIATTDMETLNDVYGGVEWASPDVIVSRGSLAAMLINSGAWFSADASFTPLHHACIFGDPTTAAALLLAGGCARAHVLHAATLGQSIRFFASNACAPTLPLSHRRRPQHQSRSHHSTGDREQVPLRHCLWRRVMSPSAAIRRYVARCIGQSRQDSVGACKSY